jgi:hypothetical protein
VKHLRKYIGSRFYLAIGILLLVLYPACTDFLEDVTPNNALPLDNGLDTEEALETFLTGTYALLEDLAIIFSDLTTEDTEPIPAACPAPLEFNRNDLGPTNSFVGRIWERKYRLINQANIIIERVSELLQEDRIDRDEADRISGEAYFLRGVNYFDLIRLFALPRHVNRGEGPGVPLVLEGVDNTDKISLPARASIAMVYDQIRDDLTTARQLLPVNEGAEGKASYYSAIAYLAAVAFHNEEYDLARDWCLEIINAGIYDLVEHPETFFRQKGNIEEIWSVIRSAQERGELYNFTIAPICNGFVLRPDLYDRAYAKIVTVAQSEELDANGWIAADLRYSTLTFDDGGLFRVAKYTNSLGADNLPAKRFAEIVLMYAECQARLGNISDAIVYLNMVRSRAIEVRDGEGNIMPDDVVLFSEADFSTTNELIETIILERQVELVMEGNRFHDLIRLRRDVNGLPYDHDKLRWPIPQDEIDVNPNLMQNPGY